MKITMVDVLDFVRGLSEPEQKKIYKYVADCVRESRRKKSAVSRLNFRLGQRVCWNSQRHDGYMIFGEIVKLNTKSATIVEENERPTRWTVDYALLGTTNEKIS